MNNNNKPLISVAFPVYNTAPFLDKSIPSVLRQDYKNIELVIINNGSTDNSLEIIKKYAAQDARIKYTTIEHVNTPKESRDNAIARSSGEWVTFVDSDDVIEDNYLSKLMQRQEETGADFVGGIMVFRDVNDNIAFTIPKEDFDLSSIYSGMEAMVRTLGDWEFGCNGSLWRRSIITNLATDQNSKNYSDECDTRMYLNNCKIVAFTEAFYYVSHNPNSTGRKRSVTSLTYGLKTYVGIYDYLKSKYSTTNALLIYSKMTLSNLQLFTLIELIKHKHIYSKQLDLRTKAIIEEANNICRKREYGIHDMVMVIFNKIIYPIFSVCYYNVLKKLK